MNGQSCAAWRLLYDDMPQHGAWNMACDEALLRSAGAGAQPPTLRVYAWEPAALSLGYGQRAASVDEAFLRESGWGLVRRLTGGRAILHTGELTYSLTLPKDHLLAQGSVIESYGRISAALAEAARRLGVEPEATVQEAVGAGTAVCFETPSHYELTVGGRKLVGSAQARRYDGLLQHGSWPLGGDLGRIADALAFPGEVEREAARQAVREKAVTLSEAAGRRIEWAEAAAALMAACETTFDCVLEPGGLTDEERACSEMLMRAVYGNPAWVTRR